MHEGDPEALGCLRELGGPQQVPRAAQGWWPVLPPSCQLRNPRRSLTKDTSHNLPQGPAGKFRAPGTFQSGYSLFILFFEEAGHLDYKCLHFYLLSFRVAKPQTAAQAPGNARSVNNLSSESLSGSGCGTWPLRPQGASWAGALSLEGKLIISLSKGLLQRSICSNKSR